MEGSGHMRSGREQAGKTSFTIAEPEWWTSGAQISYAISSILSESIFFSS